MCQQEWLGVGGSVSGLKWRIAILSNRMPSKAYDRMELLIRPQISRWSLRMDK